MKELPDLMLKIREMLREIVLFPNVLPGTRLLMGCFFWIQEPSVRIFLVCAAAGTDFLDGYFARKWGVQSRLGVILDPLSDKFFVGMAVGCFWLEGGLNGVAASLFFMREWVLLWFVGYLFLKGSWRRFTMRSFWSGKVMTTLQFVLLLLLSGGIAVPVFWFALFIPFAVSIGCELWWAEARSECIPNERVQN